MGMTFHALTGCLSSQDLNEVYDDEQRHPGELYCGPNDENDGSRIFVVSYTVGFGYDSAESTSRVGIAHCNKLSIEGREAAFARASVLALWSTRRGKLDKTVGRAYQNVCRGVPRI